MNNARALLLLLLLAGTAWAQTCTGNVLTPGGVVEDFEDGDLSGWTAETGGSCPSPYNCTVTNSTSGPLAGSRSLLIQLDTGGVVEGGWGVSLIGTLRKTVTATDEICQSFKIRISKGAGDTCNNVTSGYKVSREQAAGLPHEVVTNLETSNNPQIVFNAVGGNFSGGSPLSYDGYLPYDTTAQIVVYKKLNTPGVSNGILRYWKNGVLLKDYSNVNWRGSSAVDWSIIRDGNQYDPRGCIADRQIRWDDLIITDGPASVSALSYSTTSLAFGNQEVSVASAPLSVILTNSSASAVAITSISVTAGGADFSKSSDNCGASLAASSNCTVEATFTPSGVGAKTGTLRFVTAEGTQDVSLSGTGTGTAAPTITLTCTAFVPLGQAITCTPVTTNATSCLMGVATYLPGGAWDQVTESALPDCSSPFTFTPTELGMYYVVAVEATGVGGTAVTNVQDLYAHKPIAGTAF